MNTTAQIARLRAEAELSEAEAWDRRAEAYGIYPGWPVQEAQAICYAVSCRERAAAYIQDAQKAEAGTLHATTDQAKERV